jgi:polysaccharide biosynthesis protein PelA
LIKIRKLYWSLLVLWLLLLPILVMANPKPSAAFFYAANPPVTELKAFDMVMVDPTSAKINPVQYQNRNPYSQLFAYVSVGELDRYPAGVKSIDSTWVIGKNKAWGTRVLDLSNPKVRQFLLEHFIKPFWQQGYRGFFLDTLDSYQLAVKNDKDVAAQQRGLIAFIKSIKQQYPKAKLILNRGFDILPKVHQDIMAVAAESLFTGWYQAKKQYLPVPEKDREWLLSQLNKVKQHYHLPAIVIDYLPAAKRAQAKEVADKIAALGFIPWVANHALSNMGVGAITVLPRQILMLYAAKSNTTLMQTDVLTYAAMPLEYLGYVPIFRSINKPFLTDPLVGRYAGIVVWLNDNNNPRGPALLKWLDQQAKQGMKIAFVNNFGVPFTNANLLAKFGLQTKTTTSETNKLTITKQAAMVGFEIKPYVHTQDFTPLKAINAEVLFQVRNNNNDVSDLAAITPWGGYVLSPIVLLTLPNDQMRWVINPFAFFKRALDLPKIPVPDVTTANGLRLLMVHVDGDGFPSKAEWPNGPYSAQVLLDDILKKYKIPQTISVIQGEVAPDGLYPKQAQALEKIARAIFALPWVQIASHSYSHPYKWRKAEHEVDLKNTQTIIEGYRLPIKNYTFNLKKEIIDSVNYINKTLAPPNKRCQIFLWTGDTDPSEAAVKMTYRIGLLNMNGGDTVITNDNPSLTAVAPLGVYKGQYFQVFAPNQNENIYTNNWTGPFFSYQRAIETFKLTNKPRRLKPINIYYHFYSATKRSSLRALTTVYDWALRQQTFKIYASDYINKVLDFNRLVIAKIPNGWMLRGNTYLRELRIPKKWGVPDLFNSQNVIGFKAYLNSYYIHLGPALQTRLILTNNKIATIPYLVSANGFVEGFSRHNNETIIKLKGYLPLKFALANVGQCQVSINDQKQQVSRGVQVSTFQLKDKRVAIVKVTCQ